MFTNNFYNYLKCTALNINLRTTSVSASISGIVDINGAAKSIESSGSTDSNSCRPNDFYNTNIFLKNFIAVGTGNTPPELTDYKLEAQNDSLNLSISSQAVRNLSETHTRIIWTITGFSSSMEAVTISEIGLFKTLFKYNNGVYSDGTILLARSLLPNPITVQPQENFLINYEIVI